MGFQNRRLQAILAVVVVVLLLGWLFGLFGGSEVATPPAVTPAPGTTAPVNP